VSITFLFVQISLYEEKLNFLFILSEIIYCFTPLKVRRPLKIVTGAAPFKTSLAYYEIVLIIH